MNNYKNDFPIFSNISTTYLDNAATAQRPASVIEAEHNFYVKHNANPLRGIYQLSVEATEQLENGRREVRRFIGAASSDEIIFTRNTTESLNLVAYSYGLSHVNEGDEVLVSITEHHSDLLPWQMVCREKKATLKFIDCEQDGSIDLNKVEKLITDKTKIVAIAQVSNILGRINPIKEIAALAHAKGAVIVVDGAQSTPHIPVNVQELDADFLAFSGHKLYGPMGIGVLYGKRELLDDMPPFMSGGEMIETVSRTGAVYAELPHKFEAGTVNGSGAAGLGAAIRYIDSVGFDTIHKLELEASSYAFNKMKEMPHIHIIGSDKAEEHNGIITFTIDDVHPHDVAEIFASDDIAIRAGHHCAQPLLEHLGYRATVRASFAFYNTVEDAEKFINSLSTIRERMGYGK